MRVLLIALLAAISYAQTVCTYTGYSGGCYGNAGIYPSDIGITNRPTTSGRFMDTLAGCQSICSRHSACYAVDWFGPSDGSYGQCQMEDANCFSDRNPSYSMRVYFKNWNSCGRRCGSYHHLEQQKDPSTQSWYTSSSVVYPRTCTPSSRFRICDDGSWSSWTGAAYTSCTVTEKPCSNPTVAHGGYRYRNKYLERVAFSDEGCVRELQSAECIDTAWSAWTGSYTAKSCVQQTHKPSDWESSMKTTSHLGECAGFLFIPTSAFENFDSCRRECAINSRCRAVTLQHKYAPERSNSDWLKSCRLSFATHSECSAVAIAQREDPEETCTSWLPSGRAWDQFGEYQFTPEEFSAVAESNAYTECWYKNANDINDVSISNGVSFTTFAGMCSDQYGKKLNGWEVCTSTLDDCYERCDQHEPCLAFTFGNGRGPKGCKRNHISCYMHVADLDLFANPRNYLESHWEILNGSDRFPRGHFHTLEWRKELQCSWKTERIDAFFRLKESDSRIIFFLEDGHTFVLIALISTISFYYFLLYCIVACYKSNSNPLRKGSTMYRVGKGITGALFDKTFRSTLFPRSPENKLELTGYKLYLDWFCMLSCMQKLGWSWQFMDILAGGCFILSICNNHQAIAYGASVFYIFSVISFVALLILDVSQYASSPRRTDRRRALRIRWGILVFVPLEDIPMIIFSSYIFFAENESYYSFLSLVISAQSILFYYPLKVVFEQQGIAAAISKNKFQQANQSMTVMTPTPYGPESAESANICHLAHTPTEDVDHGPSNHQRYLQNQSYSPNAHTPTEVVEHGPSNHQRYLQNQSYSPNPQPGSVYSIEISYSSRDLYATTPEKQESRIPQAANIDNTEGEREVKKCYLEGISPGGVKRKAKKLEEWSKQQKSLHE